MIMKYDIDKMANRIAKLRANAGLRQDELAKILCNNAKREKIITVAAVSSWERGRRRPAPDMIKGLANYFRVTETYILGLTDNPASDIPDKDKKIDSFTKIRKIKKESLQLYHSKPLFLEFKDNRHHAQWCLYDALNNRFVLTDGMLSDCDDSISDIYSFEPYLDMLSEKPLRLAKVLSMDKVYVKMITSDKQVQQMYDGWYSHNENHTRLINTLGLTLPYEGINQSYYAFGR